MVIVNLYPFVRAAANPATPFEALVEQIDIGGPSLVRAAAKNFRGVLVVVDPADYPRLLTALDESPSLAFRYELMARQGLSRRRRASGPHGRPAPKTDRGPLTQGWRLPI